MFKLFLQGDENYEKAFLKASKKFELDTNEIKLVSYDSFLTSLIYMIAVANKKLYVFSTDNKKPEQFNLLDLKEIRIDKKTDLNLYLRTGRVINLTSVVGVKPKVLRTFKRLTEELQRLR